jgi:dTDP-4-dehydrorhamnose reductase
MRVLVTGAGGQLGLDLLEVLDASPAYESVIGRDRSGLDVTDPASVAETVADVAPDVVVNAAAYTAVDAAEDDEESAVAGNVTGPENLARACARVGATLVHVSTDYVFAGDADTPYDVDDPLGPRTVYGRTKAEGEAAVRAVLPGARIVRTAWLYGAGGPNFVRTMSRLALSGRTVTVVDDQVGSPTWSRHLAQGLALAPTAPPGTYHLAGSGSTSWFGFARAVFEELGVDPQRVQPCTTADMPRPAPRPAYSVLSDRAWREAGLPGLPEWRTALAQAFARSRDAFTAA